MPTNFKKKMDKVLSLSWLVCEHSTNIQNKYFIYVDIDGQERITQEFMDVPWRKIGFYYLNTCSKCHKTREHRQYFPVER
jgi:hypothetical protein